VPGAECAENAGSRFQPADRFRHSPCGSALKGNAGPAWWPPGDTHGLIPVRCRPGQAAPEGIHIPLPIRGGELCSRPLGGQRSKWTPWMALNHGDSGRAVSTWRRAHARRQGCAELGPIPWPRAIHLIRSRCNFHPKVQQPMKGAALEHWPDTTPTRWHPTKSGPVRRGPCFG